MLDIANIIAIIIVHSVYKRFFTPLLIKIDALCKKSWISIVVIVLLYLLFLNCLHFIFQIFQEKNIYQIFELSSYCSDSELHKQFKQISKVYHPDRNPNNEEIYFKLGSYYDTLADLKTRYMYDKFGIKSQTRPDSVLADLFIEIMITYKSMIQIFVVMIINFKLNIKFSVSFIQFLSIFSLITYLVFVKHSFDVFDILFPRMLPFEIVNILTSGMAYHVLYISQLIHFFQNKVDLILDQKKKRILRHNSHCKVLQHIQGKLSNFRFRQMDDSFLILKYNPYNRIKKMNKGEVNIGNFDSFINI